MKRHNTSTCHACGQEVQRANGPWLRQVRLKADVSLRETARALAISASHLCDIEKGRRACPDFVEEFYAAKFVEES